MVVAPTLGIRGRVVIGAQLVTFCRHSIIGETSVTCVTRSFVTRSFSYRFRLPHTMYFLFYIISRACWFVDCRSAPPNGRPKRETDIKQ